MVTNVTDYNVAKQHHYLTKAKLCQAKRGNKFIEVVIQLYK